MKDTIIVNPRSLSEAKDSGAFIKEFEAENSVIQFNNNDFIIKEVYLTYLIDSEKVYNHTYNLVFRTYDVKNKKYDSPDYRFFNVSIDSTNYNIGHRSRKLICGDIPINTENFKLIYNDNNIKKTINFKEKIED
jgi:hypothetical protein